MDKDSIDFLKQFKDVLLLHERTLRYLESSKSDPNLLKNYKLVNSYLKNLDDSEICSILAPKVKKSAPAKAQQPHELEDNQIESLTIENIEEILMRGNSPRKYLERIAVVKFGVSKGGVSSLPNRDAVIEKIHTMINNEQSHKTIAKLAGDTKDNVQEQLSLFANDNNGKQEETLGSENDASST